MPKEIVRRGLLAPSMIAHVLAQKFMMGVPFYRQEKQFSQIGCPIDRGTMSRYAEEVGATLGSIVLAMSKDAKKNAFCLSTDATGVSIQLGPLQERERGPCRKGHFFIVLADREHVFFEYQAKHTSAAVCEMFRGYQGYLQADAHRRSMLPTTRCSSEPRAVPIHLRTRSGVGVTRAASSGKQPCASTRSASRVFDESTRCLRRIARSRTSLLRGENSGEMCWCAR
jgi:hypothetical protein